MSSTVESRVLEMRFDNDEFEKNARTTLDTLASLKKALEENVNGSAFENLDRAARNVDLSSIESSLEALTDRFSTLGIVGMRVIENLTDGLMNLVNKGLNYATSAITEGGMKRAMNIESARFQLQGLIDDEQTVETIMQNALDSVDGTAYAYDEAAKAASMFAATGIQAGEEMEQALKGIAGVAATTNADYESMAHIFTTAAGQGKVMTEQLRQLENRGLNAAAALSTYFNGVNNGSIEASTAVQDLINKLTVAEGKSGNVAGVVTQSADEQYEAEQKALDDQYKQRKKAYDAEYKDLKKELDAEYTLKKKEYDASYTALSKSLDAEITAQQKANQERVKEANQAYQDQVQAYRDATQERIDLINEEYTESIKLIDEERYNKIKAAQEKIDAINAEAEAEQKAKKKSAQEAKRAELQKIIDNAKSTKTRQQAEEVLAEFEAELAEEKAAEDRQNQIKELNQEISNINDEANEKKKAALDKRNTDIKIVQDESNARLTEMSKTHEAEMEALRESQAAQIEEMREKKAEQLNTVKEANNNELATFREGQTAQLEALRETQSEQLEELKDSNSNKLKELKSYLKESGAYMKQYGNELGVTEADIRDMVTDGMISFDLFSEAMGTTFGDHAKDANKTFDGAMANIRSALARTGAMFYSPLIEQEGPMVDMFNAIREKINEMNGQLKPFADFVTSWINEFLIPKVTKFVENLNVNMDFGWERLLGISNLLQSAVNIFKFLGSVIGIVVDAFKEIFSLDSKSFYDMSESLENFTRNLKVSDGAADSLARTIKSIGKFFKTLWNIVKRLVKSFSPLTKLFGEADEASGDLSETFEELVDRFADWVDNSSRLEKVFETITAGVGLFVDVLIKASTGLRDFFTNLRKNSEDGSESFLSGFVNGIKKFGQGVFDAVISFCNTIITTIKKILGIESPSKITFEFGEDLIQGFINGIKNIAEKAIDIVSSAFTKVIDTIKGVLSGFNSDNVNMNGEAIGGNFIADFIRGVREAIPNPIDAMKEFFAEMRDKILKMKIGNGTGESYIQGFIEGFNNGIGGKVISKISEIFSKVTSAIHDFFTNFAQNDGELTGKDYILGFIRGVKEKISEKGAEAIAAISKAFSDLKDKIPTINLIAGAAAGMTALVAAVAAVKSGFLNKIIKPFKLIKSIFKGINWIKEKENIEEFISTVSEKVKFIPENILEGIKVGLEKGNWAINMVGDFFGRILQKIKDVFGIASPAKEIIAIAENIVTTFVTTISNLIGPAADKIVELFGKIKDGIVNVFSNGFSVLGENIPSALAIVGGITLILALIKLSKRLDTIIGPFKRINSVLFNISKALKAFAFDTYAEGILKMSAAFAIFLGSIAGFIWVVSQMDSIDANVLMAIALAIVAFITTVRLALDAVLKIKETQLSIFSSDPKENALLYVGQGIKKMIKQFGFAAEMKAFARSVATIVGSFAAVVYLIHKYDDEEIAWAIKILIGMAVAVAMMGGVGTIISGLVKKYRLDIRGASSGVLKMGGTVLILAGSLWIIVQALKDIVNMDIANNTDRFIPAAAAIAILLGVLAGLVAGYMWMSSKIEAKGQKISAGPVVAFALLLFASVMAFKKILEMNFDWDKNKKKIWALVAILLTIGIVVGILEASSVGASGTFKAGGTILAMCVWLYAAIGAIALIAEFEPKVLVKGIVSIIFLCIAIAIVVANASNASPGAFKTIIAMAAALAACLFAIGVFATFKTEALIKGVAAVCILLLVMGYTFAQVAKVSSNDGTVKAWSMVGALVAIGASLFLLSKQHWGAILAAGGAIAGVLLAYAKAFKVISGVKTKDKGWKEFLKGIIFLGVIAGALWLLSNNKFGGSWSQILSAGAAISAVMIFYGGVFKTISDITVSPYSMNMFLKGSLSLIVIGAALAIVSNGAFGGSWSQILLAGIAISGTLEAYADVFKKLEGVNVKKKQINRFLLGSVSLLMIGATLWLVSNGSFGGSWNKILASAVAVSGTLEAYADVFKKINGVKTNFESVASFVGASFGVLLIGCSLAVVASTNDWKSITAAAISVSGTLEAYTDVFKKLNGVDLNKDNILKFVVGAIAIGVIGGVLAAIITVPDVLGHPVSWSQMLSTAVSIGLVLEVLAHTIPIFNGIKMNWDGAKSLLAGVLAAFGIGLILDSITDTDNILSKALAISVVLVAVAVVTAICVGIGTIIAGSGGMALLGTGGAMALMEAFIYSLAWVCTKIVDLASIFPEGNIEQGKKNLIAIGEGIGGFFGAIIGSFTNEIGRGISELGTYLSEFWNNAKGFFEGLESLDDNAVDKASILAGVALALSSSEFINALSDMINAVNPFSKDMEDKFRSFGKSIKAFGDETKDINGWNTKNVAEACYYLTGALTNIHPVRDILKGLGAEWFGSSLKKFSAAIKGVLGPEGFNGIPNPEDYENASKSMIAIGNIFDKDTGIKARDFRDAEDLPEYGQNLSEFAKYIRIVSVYGSQLTETTPFQNVVDAANIIMPLATSGKKMISKDNFISEFVGTNDAAGFGANLLNFCKILCGSSEEDKNSIWGVIKSVNLVPGRFETVRTVAEKMGAIAEYVPTINGKWKSFWVGDNSASGFAEDFSTFVTKLRTIQRKISGGKSGKGIDPQVFINFETTIQPLINIIEKLRGFMALGEDSYIDIGKQFTSLGKGLENFGKGIKNLGDKTTQGYVGFSGAVELLERFVAIMPDLLTFDGSNVTGFFDELKANAATALSTFLESFSKSETPVGQAIATMFSFISSAITDKKDLMEGFGRIIVGYMIGENGMTSQDSVDKMAKAIETLIGKAKENINLDKLYKLGYYGARGFADGLIGEEAQEVLERAGKRFARMVYNDIADPLKIESPSKETAKLGEFTGLGFIGGLLSLANNVKEAGTKIGDNATEGLRLALTRITENIQNEDDFNPTITPVLDLSNIEANADKIGGILNVDEPMRLAANAGMSFTGGLNGMLGGIQAAIPDGSNADVVTAIGEMRADIAQMSAAIRQMQIVMDTGELVGVLTDPLDDSLGFNSVLNTRGVR